MRYIGPIHAMGLMYREEGMRGLYRGYFAYLIATSIFTACVPFIASLSVLNKPITGVFDDHDSEIDRLYDEVMSKN